jgi:polar amino acid transport system substrate-binding protein
MLVAISVATAACSGPRLADPPAVTAAPTTTTPAPPAPECTAEEEAEEAELDATRSYEPDGPLPPPGEMPTGSTMAEISDRDRLIVGVSADTLQFGAVDPISGVVEGFDIDILKEVANAIFGPGGEDKIEYRVMTFAERLPSLESGAVDLVAHTMTINCDRWKRIAFSSTYYAAGKKVLVDADSGWSSVEDLVADAARVCAPQGSTSLALISEPQYTAPTNGARGVQVVERPDVTACLVAVQQGEADAIVGDDTVLVGLAAQDRNLVIVGDFLTDEPYGIGVNAEQVDLVRYVNAVLEELRADGRWARIYETWVGRPAPAPPEPVYGR